MKISRIYRHGMSTVSEWSVSAGLSGAVDRLLFGRLVFTRGQRRSDAGRGYHLLIGPPGGGNIGDQAMVEAFLESTAGDVLILVRSTDDLVVPPMHTTRVQIAALPALLYRDGLEHARDVRRYRRLIDAAASVSVVGADIMDGGYSLRASVRRANLAERAASTGVDTRILGFSWSESPRAAARRALRHATRSGAVAMLRDPLSAARARADGVSKVTEVADVVFAATTEDHGILDRLGVPEAERRSLVVVNVSGLIGRFLDQSCEYVQLIAHLREAGRSVLLLPHVLRKPADDLAACAAVYDRVAGDGVFLADRLLSPAEVRGICVDAEFVITGRMHLAIMAMWAGKPAITLATQGKVEGLMSMFSSVENCIDPRPGFASDVIESSDRIMADPSASAADVSLHLPAVREAARANFAGLVGSEAEKRLGG